MNFTTYLKYLPFYTLSVLPMPILYLFSDMLFIVVYHIIGYRKKVVWDNLEKAFPSKTQNEILAIQKDFYRHFCDIILEAIKTLTVKEKCAKERLFVRNPNLPMKYLEREKKILLYAAHLGNWEWLVYLPLYLKYPAYTFYRPLQNKYFNDLMLIIRQRFGVKCVESKKGYRTIIEQDRSGIPAMNCLIADQSPRDDEPVEWRNFFGRKTAFFVGTEKIASRTDSAVLFPKFTKIKRGRYEVEFYLIGERAGDGSLLDVIEAYARQLENSIVQSPALWLWSHRRWKLSPSPTSEPSMNNKTGRGRMQVGV